MKLRIRDNSFRFRISIRELEQLRKVGSLLQECRFDGTEASAFSCAIQVVDSPQGSGFQIEPFLLTLRLSKQDLEHLEIPENEGTYLRREWIDESGETQRGIAFVEKDRPGSGCEKPEEWIYEDTSRTQSPRTGQPAPGVNKRRG